jgi:hypothetical protein
MASIQDTIKEKQRAMLPTRLLRGAGVLGDLWRSGLRCAGGWSPDCPLEAGENDFCVAKKRWIALYLEHAEHVKLDTAWILFPASNRFAVIEAMSVRQFEATGLTALVEVPFSTKPVRVGKKGTDWRTVVDLGLVWNGDPTKDNTDYITALKSVEMIQGVLG